MIIGVTKDTDKRRLAIVVTHYDKEGFEYAIGMVECSDEVVYESKINYIVSKILTEGFNVKVTDPEPLEDLKELTVDKGVYTIIEQFRDRAHLEEILKVIDECKIQNLTVTVGSEVRLNEIYIYLDY
nr:MAG TPA: hypothetical protein [Caudoviricetes sp.]